MHQHGLELFFSGIAFEFEGPPRLLECLALAVSEPALEGPAPSGRRPFGGLGSARHDAFVRARCTVAQLEAGELPSGESPVGARQLEFELREDGFRGYVEGATARLSRVPTGSVEARLLPTPRAARNLLELLTCLLVRRHGGAILHAAAIELPEGVVAFVGPSGAGKSTSCEHVAGARHFSADRLAVVPALAPEARSGRIWSAHPLSGGTPLTTPLPPSDAQGRLLLGVLRSCRATAGHRFATASASQAIGWLRQSAFRLGRDRGAELELLGALENLATEVKVGELHFALGSALSRPLRAWLQLESARDVESGPRNERVTADRRHGAWAKGVEDGAS